MVASSCARKEPRTATDVIFHTNGQADGVAEFLGISG